MKVKSQSGVSVLNRGSDGFQQTEAAMSPAEPLFGLFIAGYLFAYTLFSYGPPLMVVRQL